jgi:hypothetical protein
MTRAVDVHDDATRFFVKLSGRRADVIDVADVAPSTEVAVFVFVILSK